MNVLSILETDLIDICSAIINEELNTIDIRFNNSATVCKYAVPEGYPDDPIKNKEIEEATKSNIGDLIKAEMKDSDKDNE